MAMLRKFLLTLLGIVLGTVVLFGAALAIAQTRVAKDQIGGLIESSLEGEQQTAEVEDVSGFLPFDIRIGRFSLADDEGRWLEVNDARVKLSPTPLLRGEVVVEEAGAARVAVQRAPNLPPAPEPEPEPETDEPFSLPAAPELPESLPLVTAERIHVDRIELGQALIGQDAVFNLEGNATTGPEGRHAEARLDLTRIDQRTAALGLAATLDLAQRRIGLDVEGSETGGLMASLTGIEQAGDLTLRLQGEGPLDDWRADLDLAIQGLVAADAGLALAYGENPSIDLHTEVVPVEGAMPEEIAAVLGDRLTLALVGGQRAPGQFVLDQLRLESGIATAEGRLEALLDENRLDGSIRVAAEDLGRASGLAGTPLAGRVELVLDALGTFSEPRFRLDLDGGGITADAFGVETLGLEVTADLLAPLDQPFAGARVEGGGEIAGITQDGEPLRPEDRLTLDLAATVPMEGEAVVERLALEGEHVAVDGTASVAMPGLGGTARLEASVPSLAELVAALGPDAPPDLAVEGAFDLRADVELAPELERITLDLAATGSGITGLPQNADALVGAEPRLTSHVVMVPGSNVAVESLDLTTAAVGLTGNLDLGLDETQALSGRVDLSPLALATLEGIIGQPIAGELTSFVTLGGTLPAPEVAADVTVVDLAIAERQFDRVALDARTSGPLAEPAGDVALAIEQGTDSLALKSDFALKGQSLELANLNLTAPFTELTGAATVALDGPLATGRLAGRVGDLAALEPWSGQELSGAIDLDATFDGSAGRQDATLSLTATDVGGDFGNLERASVEAKVEDALGRLGVDATVQAGGFSQPEPGFVLDDATVTLTGDRSLFNLDAKANGEMNGPFNVSSKARLDVLGPAQEVYLDELGGVFQAQSIELLSPATLRLDGGVLDLDQLDLKIGDATIQGGLNFDQPANRARAGLVIESFPMAMLADFGAPGLEGELTGEVDLEGPLGAPVITGNLAIDGLEYHDGDDTIGRPADVRLDLALRDARFSADASIDGLGDRPITAEFHLPVRLSLEPFAFELPEELPLDGRLAANSRLAPLVAFANLDGQQLDGQLAADLRLQGTVARPDVQGELTITGGSFSDAISGIVLDDLALTIEGKGDRLEIVSLSARDRAQGRLDASGGLGIDPDTGFPYDFTLTSRDLRVLDSDLGRARVTLSLEAKGDAEGGALSGKVEVPRADLRLPDGGVVEPTVLDVEVRGAPPKPDAATRAASGNGGGGYVLTLDVLVDMPARIFVRGRGLDTEWGGRLQVAGTSAAPSITGTIDYRRGWLDFLDRRFDIRQGTVRFIGETPPDPRITLEAAATTQTMTGIIRVTGPATDPEFELSSEPALPQDEVLSQLLFDRDMSTLTPMQGLRIANAVGRLEGGGVDAVGELRNLTGLDTLDFGNEDFGGEDTETTASAGKYVAENVFVAVDQGLSSGTTRARVEVELTPRITLRSEVDNQSRTGVGLEWSMDY